MKIKTTVRGGLQAVTSVYGGRGCGPIYPIRQTYLVP